MKEKNCTTESFLFNFIRIKDINGEWILLDLKKKEGWKKRGGEEKS